HSVPVRALTSFPTRRSSDLETRPRSGGWPPPRARGGVWVVASCQKKLVLASTIRAPSAASTRWSASRSTLSACRRSVATTHAVRSEEHTSELQSPYDLVCRL